MLEQPIQSDAELPVVELSTEEQEILTGGNWGWGGHGGGWGGHGGHLGGNGGDWGGHGGGWGGW
ncbi:hypothetical protein WDZ92_41265, partial [Nostoc sp. NIES-2111]